MFNNSLCIFNAWPSAVLIYIYSIYYLFQLHVWSNSEKTHNKPATHVHQMLQENALHIYN